jgi:mono/diheme cytochrome c family protein
MRASLLLAFCLLTGCSGLLDGNGGGQEDPAAKAQRLWLTRALPVLNGNCASCHGGAAPMPGVEFLVGGSDLAIKDTLLTRQPAVVDLNSPQKSKLLTKGAHDGPALDVTQSSDILEWIQAEKDAAGVETVIVGVTKFEAKLCTAGLPDTAAMPNPNCLVNHVALDEFGATGATIDFVMENVSGDTAIRNLQISPGTSGVFIDHPTFVTYPAIVDENRQGCELDQNAETFCTDVLDRFANVVKNIAMAAPAEQIGPGNATFTDFVPTDLLSIHFNEISAFKP